MRAARWAHLSIWCAGHLLSETASYGRDLPASAWPTKDAPSANTNRQVQMGRAALPLPGEARQDLWIIQDLAQRIGCKWDYKHVGEVFTEMASMMPALDNISWTASSASTTSPIRSTGRTCPAATSCSTRDSRGPAASPGWWRRIHPARRGAGRRLSLHSSPPGASSSIGTPAP